MLPKDEDGDDDLDIAGCSSPAEAESEGEYGAGAAKVRDPIGAAARILARQQQKGHVPEVVPPPAPLASAAASAARARACPTEEVGESRDGKVDAI